MLAPKWAYGFWQSRQRYETQDQLLGVLHKYRKLGLPLDNIVQDWLYWPQDGWGCQCFDPARFPDPKGMVDDIHRNNAHVMISVWAKYYKGLANYDAFLPVHGMLERMANPLPSEPKDHDYIKDMYLDWVGPGYFNAFYDPYNPAARDIYWRQVRDGIACQGLRRLLARFRRAGLPLEPVDRGALAAHGPDRCGPGRALLQLLSARTCRRRLSRPHRLQAGRPPVHPDALRPSPAFSATALRCGRATSPRAGTISASRSPRASTSRCPAIPNWSTDIGGYTMEPRFLKPTPADLDEWRELNLRWFQFGAFSPLFRSHGENIHREIFEIAPAGSPMYRSMAWYDRLRYRLMPYIYTVGGRQLLARRRDHARPGHGLPGGPQGLGRQGRVSVRSRVPGRACHRLQGA